MVHLVLFLLGLCLGIVSITLGIVVDFSQLTPKLWTLVGMVAQLGPPTLGMGLLYLLVPPTAPASITYGLLIGWAVGAIGSVEYVKKYWPQLIPQKESKGG